MNKTEEIIITIGENEIAAPIDVEYDVDEHEYVSGFLFCAGEVYVHKIILLENVYVSDEDCWQFKHLQKGADLLKVRDVDESVDQFIKEFKQSIKIPAHSYSKWW